MTAESEGVSEVPRIFVSYRGDDTAGYAILVHNALAERFGEQRVFMDVDTIRPGHAFAEVIEEHLDRCDVFLALVGRRWLTERLREPRDFVRMELAAALRRQIPVIPLRPPSPGA